MFRWGFKSENFDSQNIKSETNWSEENGIDSQLINQQHLESNVFVKDEYSAQTQVTSDVKSEYSRPLFENRNVKKEQG